MGSASILFFGGYIRNTHQLAIFEIVQETGSRWLSSALWECFRGCGIFNMAANSLTMHFENHLEPVSFATSTCGFLLCYSWMKYLPWRIIFLLIWISIWARIWVSAGNNNYGIHVVTTCKFLLCYSLMYMYYLPWRIIFPRINIWISICGRTWVSTGKKYHWYSYNLWVSSML